jgi:Rrf2 family protein
MRFSSRAHYGLRAMVELARAYEGGALSLGDIARSEDLSLGYLEQLMAKLRRGGLVEATRGARGGYRLAARPSSITVGQVLRALDGPVALVECVSEETDARHCGREAACPSRQMWRKIRDTLVDVLDTTTLSDLFEPPGVDIQAAAQEPVSILPGGLKEAMP